MESKGSDNNSSEETTENQDQQQSTTSRSIPITSPNRDLSSLNSDRLKYPSRDATYFSQLYNQPIVTTLSSFSHVANLVRNPYELINNVDEFVKQASSGAGQVRKYQRTSDNFAKTLNQNRHSSTPTSPILQEMDTFVASSPNQSALTNDNNHKIDMVPENQIPIPTLPAIECSTKRGRLEPLTIEEYESKYRKSATDLELLDRVFFGSIACNQLRAVLWPYLFGIVKHRGSFTKIFDGKGKEAHVYQEDRENMLRWGELIRLYNVYQDQWKSILPDQELRFSAFRERKSLIDRDVIRCDRLHPFYAEKPEHLATLTNLLMTYMMYDFDIGYVQGMSDLAGPILYMYNGDLVKSFWVFVEVMKLFRRNFELTQKTIHFQLECLYHLIKNTDPIFAQYLEKNESSNCFFTFRAIVCQFKREIMRDDEDGYSNVLFLWDTIWSVKRRVTLQEELKALTNDIHMNDEKEQSADKKPTGERKSSSSNEVIITEQPSSSIDEAFYPPFDPNQSDCNRHTLTETEIFVLALCLSMIRRERDLIMANRLDETNIQLHFINLKLANDLNCFIEHAINIYSYMKTDFDIKKLTSPKEQISPSNSAAKTSNTDEGSSDSPQRSADGYDLLSDFLIINGASGS